MTAQPNGHQKCHIECYQTFERSMEEHLLNLLNCSLGLLAGMVGMWSCGNQPPVAQIQYMRCQVRPITRDKIVIETCSTGSKTHHNSSTCEDKAGGSGFKTSAE